MTAIVRALPARRKRHGAGDVLAGLAVLVLVLAANLAALGAVVWVIGKAWSLATG